MRYVLYVAIFLMLIFHQDLWNWNDATLVFGFFPVGFLYHVVFCFLATVLLFLLVRFDWPGHLEDSSAPPKKDT